MRISKSVVAIVIWIGTFAAGCGQSVDSTSSSAIIDHDFRSLDHAKMTYGVVVQPFPLDTVSVGKRKLIFWPYTGTDFTGRPQDPINLIFIGQVDPRDLRTALMSLDGNRTALGLPAVAPFNSRWDDAIGEMQAAFVQPSNWVGCPIQLQCGTYEGPRFHIRFFQMGQWTVANAHFEVLTPGTTDHQVLSWELAEQFVVADLMRSGVLDPTTPVVSAGAINESPFDAIPANIYNGLPEELRSIIGGPLGDVTQDVSMTNDGHASLLRVATRMPYHTGGTTQDFILNFDQMIPKPICASGSEDYLYVTGPVHFRQSVSLGPSGNWSLSFRAEGELSVLPINPMTGAPIGPSLPATVREDHSYSLTDKLNSAVSERLLWLGKPSDEGSGRSYVRMKLSSDGNNGIESSIRCPN